jgi:hypothetical protein
MVQFFLKHAELLDLLQHYDPSTPGLHKGLVFTVDSKLVMIPTSDPSKSSPQYIAEAHVFGVVGSYQDAAGNLVQIPGTDKTPCPHPPPCGLNKLTGQYEIDENIAPDIVAKCYPQT